MRMERTDKLNKDMLDLIEYHLPGRSRDTISWYENFKHDTVLFYDDDGILDGMLSYFILDFKFDTMIAMQRDNKFYKMMWKILKDTIANRQKPLRIMSDPTNKVLVEGAKRHGGVWHHDEIWFY
jgi:hypothetical protein